VTSITVAHRFATVIDSDEIVLLVNGSVTERGTHDDLLKKGGEYATIYGLQTQRHLASIALGEEK
jgi:ABC-type transport system involved in Fe-S cluster assembly fused permease/ATPase subunit